MTTLFPQRRPVDRPLYPRRRAAGASPAGWPLSATPVLVGLVLVASYVPVVMIGASGPHWWTVSGVATVFAAMVVGGRLTGVWWAARPGGARGSEHWSQVLPSSPVRPSSPVWPSSPVLPNQPRVIREPESGWWDAQPDSDPTAVTVAVVDEQETQCSAQGVVARLAELAINDELLVVYGSTGDSISGPDAVLSGLRTHLPRYDIIAMHVALHGDGLRREAATMVQGFLECGTLPIVVTPAAAVPSLTAELSCYLQADRVLRVSGTTHGVDLHHVWQRHAVANAN